jgi:hypothetical protein
MATAHTSLFSFAREHRQFVRGDEGGAWEKKKYTYCGFWLIGGARREFLGRPQYPRNAITNEKKNHQIRYHLGPSEGLSVTFYDWICHGPFTNM